MSNKNHIFNPNAASHFVEVCRLCEFLFRKLSNIRSYMLHFVFPNHTCYNNVLGLKNSKSFYKLLIIFYFATHKHYLRLKSDPIIESL